ncbi:sodium-coupled monocarboxylate transporter 1 [Lepeophtheirus salmonis]|uniref:sodium-coupled monocarboxylate transporter 1 n=1 Tax=Lepeophtheirus salmonis TaxID=72036 RepID=UPI001AE6C7DF|nr:sodium-coupled monocarboxylate transporter 1-like [Lepeophtheirus salmonis]
MLTRQEAIDKFGPEEYVIFGLTLGISILIGAFFAIKSYCNKSIDTKTILLGGGDMGIFPMTLSLVASFMSAITLLGTPAEVYVDGTQYIVLILSYPLVLASTAEWYLPVFWRLKVTTSYEYLEWRFNKAVRFLGALAFTFQMVIYMSIVVFAPALALEQLTGFSSDQSIPIIFSVCVVYTSMGGMKAVMWTDTFQSFMMFASFIAIIVKGNYDAGGSYAVFDKNYKSNRIELFNFDLDMRKRHTVFGLIIGGYFTWLTIYGVNQTQVQRYLSVSKIETAKKAIYWNILGIGSLLGLCAYAGMVMFGFYSEIGCDPLAAKVVDKKDQLFPFFVMEIVGDVPLIPGFFVAGVFSGALSTVSSGLNALSAIVLKDFFHGVFRLQISDRTEALLTLPLSIFFGLVSYGFVYPVKILPGVLEAALSIFGFIGGPILGVFTLGMFIPQANSIGAIVGMLSSMFLTTWMCVGQTVGRYFKYFDTKHKEIYIDGCPKELNVTLPTLKVPDTSASYYLLPIYEVSYIWYGGIATLLCVVVGTIVSFFTTPQDISKLNPNLISPGLRSIFDWIMIPFIKKPWHKYIDSIGSKYTISDKELELMQNQILHTDDENEGDNMDMDMGHKINHAYISNDEKYNLRKTSL